jgi:dTDP-4-dehydrorhamnose reductase
MQNQGTRAPRRILVTGATGLLGSSAVPFLRQLGHEVIAHGFHASAEIRFDLTDSAAVQAALDSARPQAVLNLVALADVDQCQADENQAFRVNATAVGQLARACQAGGIALTHISTDHLYDADGRTGQPAAPSLEDEVRIRNVYAASKLAGDQEAQRAGATVLRTNFFGRSQHPTRRSFSDWIVASFQRGQGTRLFEDVYFSPLTLQTLCAMIERTLREPIPGIFNLGSREGLSKCQFGLEVAKALGLDSRGVTRVSVEDAGFPAPRPKDMRMNSGKFEAAYGVTLPTLAQELKSIPRDYEGVRLA